MLTTKKVLIEVYICIKMLSLHRIDVLMAARQATNQRARFSVP